MKLEKILSGIEYELVQGSITQNIESISYDSRDIEKILCSLQSKALK